MRSVRGFRENDGSSCPRQHHFRSAAQPHKPKGLPLGKIAVYAFFSNGKALKVGKLGPTAMSALGHSITTPRVQEAILRAQGFDKGRSRHSMNETSVIGSSNTPTRESAFCQKISASTDRRCSNPCGMTNGSLCSRADPATIDPRALCEDTLRGNFGIRRLATSPLLCSVICALHRDTNEEIPWDRLDLYEDTSVRQRRWTFISAA